MNYIKKHQAIAAYLRTVESATTMEIYNNVPFGYYRNASKYMSLMLSSMVKRGIIRRIKPGEFALTEPLKKALQGNLFNNTTTDQWN